MDEISPIVERELGTPPDRVVQVAEGLLHETYEVECDGEEYVLQFSSDADEAREDSLERGLHCYAMLQDFEIPVPGVVTESVREFDGRGYVLVEKLPGETGERDVSPERVRNAGKYLARIHDARSFDAVGWIRFEDGDRAGPAGTSVQAFPEGSLRGRVQRRVEESARTFRDGGLETVGEELRRVFDRVGGDLPEDFQPVLCHDDFSPDNVLFRGEAVTGIIDFDRARAGHAQRDLAKAANGFWMHDPCSEWDVRAAFYEGYREVRHLDGSFERNEPLYRVETLAGTVAGLLELDELSAYEREFYAERILEAIERLDGV